MAMAERDCGALGQAEAREGEAIYNANCGALGQTEAREGRWDLKRGRPLFSNSAAEL